jgi:hypothetical protein
VVADSFVLRIRQLLVAAKHSENNIKESNHIFNLANQEPF